MQEAGLPEYAIKFWYGFFVPAGAPPDIVRKMSDATQVAMQQPAVKAALARERTEVSISSSPADFANSWWRMKNSGCIWSKTLV